MQQIADERGMNPIGTGLEAGVYTQDPDVKSGVPVFPGTRVPVRTLQDWLEDDVPLSEFLSEFPSVTREMAINLMEHVFNQALGPRRVFKGVSSAKELRGN